MSGSTLRKAVAWSLGVALVGAVALRCYRALVPWDAQVYPWLMARVSGPVLTSPDGRRTLKVYFNNAGAMHSGNHWTWVVEESRWLGRRVVAQGYLSPQEAVSGGAVPLTWGEGNSIGVAFLAGKRSTQRKLEGSAGAGDGVAELGGAVSRGESR